MPCLAATPSDSLESLAIMPETVACNLCGSAEAVAQPRKTQILRMTEGFQICRCARCGLLYLSPRPTLAEMAALYAQQPIWAPEALPNLPERRAFDHKRMQRLERWKPGRGTLLGIGCLEGGVGLAVARARGWQVLAVEFVESLVEHVSSQLDIPVQRAMAWDLSALEGRKFDVIYGHSFEHLPDPRQTLRRCHALLEPDGLLFIDVPNQFHALKDRIKTVVHWAVGARLLKHLYISGAYHFHLYYFNPSTLRRLLASEGFEVVAFRTYLPFHPVYRDNPRGGWLQEAVYALGGLFEQGPCMEVLARKRQATPSAS